MPFNYSAIFQLQDEPVVGGRHLATAIFAVPARLRTTETKQSFAISIKDIYNAPRLHAEEGDVPIVIYSIIIRCEIMGIIQHKYGIGAYNPTAATSDVN